MKNQIEVIEQNNAPAVEHTRATQEVQAMVIMAKNTLGTKLRATIKLSRHASAHLWRKLQCIPTHEAVSK